MTERDRAAVRVDARIVVGDAELAQARERLRGERLVQLDHVDLRRASRPARASAFASPAPDRSPCMRGSTPATAVATMRASGSSAELRRAALGRDEQRAAPSLSPDELPAVTDPCRRCGMPACSFASDLERRVGANELVLDRRASPAPFFCGISTRRDLVAKRPAVARGRGLLLRRARRTRPDRSRLRHTARRRSPPSGPSSRCRTARVIFGFTKRQPRLVSNSSTSRANGFARLRHHVRRARHALDAAGDVEVALAELARRARRSRPRSCPTRTAGSPSRPGTRHRQPGEQQRHARDVAVVLAGLVRAAEDRRRRCAPGRATGCRASSAG